MARLVRATQGASTTKMPSLQSFRWTEIGLIIGAVITALALGLNNAMPEKVWPVQALAFVGRFGFWAMRDWYPAHYIDPTPWVSNLGLVIGGSLQWGVVGLVWDVLLRLIRRFSAS